ncbi:hypothetical protein P7K49_010399, partial [Saguinus oedipus]
GPPGRLSFGKTLAVPPPVSVDLDAAIARAADLRPPFAPAVPGQEGPPPPGLSPESHGAGKSLGPGPRPGRRALLAPVPTPEGACLDRAKAG